MSDSTLSQDELDALLQGSSLESTSNNILTNSEEITFSKLSNALGTARATIISGLTNKPTSLDQINLLTGNNTKITEDLSGQIIGATSTINGEVSGDWTLLAPASTALQVGNAMLGSNSTEIDNNIIEAFSEALSNSIASDVKILSEQLKTTITSSSIEPKLYNSGTELITTNGTLVRININLNIDGISYPFYIVTTIRIAKTMAKMLTPIPDNNPVKQSNNNYSDGNNNNSVNMKPAQFQQFTNPGVIEPLDNLALLLDVPMRVTVELGRTRMTIKDILNLGEGSIVELEKLAGEPVDVLVNDKLIALGEVVVIDENFSVRVTKVVTPMERIFDRENLHGKGGV